MKTRACKWRKRVWVLVRGAAVLLAMGGGPSRAGNYPVERQERLVAELKMLASHLAKRGIDIAGECRASEKADNLNLGTEPQDTVIAGAAYDAGLDADTFRARYPEIWRRSAIVAIRVFDGSGRRKVLMRRFEAPSEELKLAMLLPSMLRVDKARIEGGFMELGDFSEDALSFTGDAPIRLTMKRGRTRIEARNETDPVKNKAGQRTFLLSRVVVEYRNEEFKVTEQTSEELPASQFVRPDAFYVSFD